MALYNKVGAIMKQSISSGNAMSGQSSMFNAIRCMSTKLFVGGLSFGTDDQLLKEAFSSFGDVTYAKIIIDKDTGKSKGFGFVDFADSESASSALSSMDGIELGGRSIRVSYAQERTPRASSNYNGGYRNNTRSNDEF